MPRIRHTGGPPRFNYRALDGVSEPGDEHTVDDDTAAYLCDDRGHFERVDDEVVLSDDDYTELCGTEMSDGSTCERPAADCPYH